MSVPPCAGRLDGWTGWASLPARAHRLEPDPAEGVAADPATVDTESDPLYSDDVEHAPIVTGLREGHKSCSTSPTPLAEPGFGTSAEYDAWNRERQRLAFLRRVQYVDPRERRA